MGNMSATEYRFSGRSLARFLTWLLSPSLALRLQHVEQSAVDQGSSQASLVLLPFDRGFTLSRSLPEMQGDHTGVSMGRLKHEPTVMVDQ